MCLERTGEEESIVARVGGELSSPASQNVDERRTRGCEVWDNLGQTIAGRGGNALIKGGWDRPPPRCRCDADRERLRKARQQNLHEKRTRKKQRQRGKDSIKHTKATEPMLMGDLIEGKKRTTKRREVNQMNRGGKKWDEEEQKHNLSSEKISKPRKAHLAEAGGPSPARMTRVTKLTLTKGYSRRS